MSPMLMLSLIILPAALWCSAAGFLVAWSRLQRRPPQSAAIVVLGCRVYHDGTPSSALKRRTETAVALYKQGLAPVVFFTGAKTTGPHSEAQCASRYASTLGLPADAIALEERSASTDQNALFAAQILGDVPVTLVTDPAHALRATLCFRASFRVAHVVSTHQRLFAALRGSFREVLATLRYALSGRFRRRAP